MENSMPVPIVNFEVQGLRELERNILDLSNDYSPRQARSAFNIPMRNAFRIVEDQIRNNTPVDTGRLRELVRLMTGRTNRFETADDPNAVWAARAGWFWTSPASYSFQALAVEYGTRFQPGQRILRNALENNVQAVLSTFSQTLGEGIERRAMQLARRQARRGRR